VGDESTHPMSFVIKHPPVIQSEVRRRRTKRRICFSSALARGIIRCLVALIIVKFVRQVAEGNQTKKPPPIPERGSEVSWAGCLRGLPGGETGHLAIDCPFGLNALAVV
jgi:hypothetical protein